MTSDGLRNSWRDCTLNKAKNTDITQSLLFYLFAVVPFIKPADYVFPEIINKMLNIWQICSACLILFVYCFRKKIDSFIAVMVIFQLTILLSTLLNNNFSELKSTVIGIFSNIAICMLAEIGLKSAPKKFMKAYAYYGAFICCITMLTMFAYYPHGMDQKQYMDIRGDVNYYFIGHDNKSYFIFLAVQAAVVILSFMKHNRLSVPAVLFNIFVTAAFFYVRSGSAMIVTAMILIYLMFFTKKRSDKLFNFRNYFIILAAIFLLIVMLNLHELFSFFIVNVLGKSITISGRTIIWSKAKAYIAASPVFGYGNEPSAILMLKFGINHVHNIILDILYRQGIVGLLCYLAMTVIYGKRLMKYRSDRTGAFLAFIFLCFFLAASFDYYNHIPYMTALYAIAANIGCICGDPQQRDASSDEIKAEVSNE